MEKKSLLPVKKPAIERPMIPSTINSAIERAGLLNSMKQGFGFGLGNSLAHRLFAPNSVVEDTKKIEFTQCMEKTYTSYEDCAHLIK